MSCDLKLLFLDTPMLQTEYPKIYIQFVRKIFLKQIDEQSFRWICIHKNQKRNVWTNKAAILAYDNLLKNYNHMDTIIFPKL